MSQTDGWMRVPGRFETFQRQVPIASRLNQFPSRSWAVKLGVVVFNLTGRSKWWLLAALRGLKNAFRRLAEGGNRRCGGVDSRLIYEKWSLETGSGAAYKRALSSIQKVKEFRISPGNGTRNFLVGIIPGEALLAIGGLKLHIHIRRYSNCYFSLSLSCSVQTSRSLNWYTN